MKQISIIVGSLTAVIIFAASACNAGKSESENKEGLTGSSSTPLVNGIAETESMDAKIARGNYLVAIMGCHDCHSPKIMTQFGPQIDSANMFSGHPATLPVPQIKASELKSWVLLNHNSTAFAGPWGVSFAANISSDETGIGNWTEEQFIRSIKEGKLKGMNNTRPLLPPMPWPMYRNATDDDLKAIFAFLKSTQPVPNVVPAAIPPDGIKNLK